jgi:hypothetical protein
MGMGMGKGMGMGIGKGMGKHTAKGSLVRKVVRVSPGNEGFIERAQALYDFHTAKAFLNLIRPKLTLRVQSADYACDYGEGWCVSDQGFSDKELMCLDIDALIGKKEPLTGFCLRPPRDFCVLDLTDSARPTVLTVRTVY